MSVHTPDPEPSLFDPKPGVDAVQPPEPEAAPSAAAVLKEPAGSRKERKAAREPAGGEPTSVRVDSQRESASPSEPQRARDDRTESEPASVPADDAPEDFRSKAISLVLAGGVIAGVAGPELAKHTIDWFLPTLYAGCYVTLTLLALAILVILQGVRIPRLTEAERRDSGRPLRQIARQPVFIVAVLSGALGYGSMTLIMTATPLAMAGCGFAFSDTATVIQGHVLAMFLPSFFTGSLIQRFGNLRIIAIGSLLTAGCLAANMSGLAFANFSIGLILLGLGWNFMFVGGSTLLTRAYTVAERAKTQAANDFVVFTSSVIGAFSSGLLQNKLGWVAVNAGIAPAMLLALVAVAWFALHQRKPQATAP